MAIDDPARVQLEPASPARSRAAWSGRPLTALFATTAFSGAALLFVVEPLVAKSLLPAYGGSATVWSTSTLFFQVLLLVAYAYCHVSTRLPGRQPLLLHAVV